MREKRARGFSLVEVVLAVGIVSFALLPLMALLPVGLRTVKNSMTQTVTAAIAQQIRGELLQASLPIGSLGIEYYTSDGIKTTATDANNPFYYTATFSLSATTIAGDSFTAANAQSVTVYLSYPSSNQQPIVIPLFIARQPSIN